MKIIIQVPVYNEQENLAAAIAEIAAKSGLALSSVIVINDGSVDRSADIAGQAGILKAVDLKIHRGLGAAFKEGLKAGLALDADIIVNTDADSQYDPAEICKLLAPIIANKAEMVIGDRQISAIKGYPLYKRASQALGNRFISLLFRARIKDATSGFRAFSRDCAAELVRGLRNPYTYTVESICLLLKRKQRIVFVPVRINDHPARKSRLIRSKAYYAINYISTVLSCLLGK